MNDIFELAARLSSLSAVSGREAGCFDELEKITDGIFDSTSSLPTGTFFGRIKCEKTDAPTLLFDAHIDEIGFVVTDICEGGFLRVAAGHPFFTLTRAKRRKLMGQTAAAKRTTRK